MDANGNQATLSYDSGTGRLLSLSRSSTVGGLKYFFSGASYARLANYAASLSPAKTPFEATDAQVAAFADNYFEYDSDQRATKEVAQAASCACTAGLGTFTLAYTTSTNTAGYNSWQTKTVETLPDGNETIVYTNYRGEMMLKVFHDTTSGDKWATFYKYDADGRLILTAQPSAVTGYDDSNADLLAESSGNYSYLSDSAGLITRLSY